MGRENFLKSQVEELHKLGNSSSIIRNGIDKLQKGEIRGAHEIIYELAGNIERLDLIPAIIEIIPKK